MKARVTLRGRRLIQPTCIYWSTIHVLALKFQNAIHHDQEFFLKSPKFPNALFMHSPSSSNTLSTISASGSYVNPYIESPLNQKAIVAVPIEVAEQSIGKAKRRLSVPKAQLLFDLLRPAFEQKELDISQWHSKYEPNKSLAEALYGSLDDAQQDVMQRYIDGMFASPAYQTCEAWVDGHTSENGTFADVMSNDACIAVSGTHLILSYTQSSTPALTIYFPASDAFTVSAPMIRIERRGSTYIKCHVIPERGVSVTDGGAADVEVVPFSLKFKETNEKVLDTIWAPDSTELSPQLEELYYWGEGYNDESTFTIPRQMTELLAQFALTNVRIQVLIHASSVTPLHLNGLIADSATVHHITDLDGKEDKVNCLEQVRMKIHSACSRCICGAHHLTPTEEADGVYVVFECCGRPCTRKSPCSKHPDESRRWYGRCSRHVRVRVWCNHKNKTRMIDHEILLTPGERAMVGGFVTSAREMHAVAQRLQPDYTHAPNGEYFKDVKQVHETIMKTFSRDVYKPALASYRRECRSMSVYYDKKKPRPDGESFDVYDLANDNRLGELDEQASKLLKEHAVMRIGILNKKTKKVATNAAFYRERRLYVDADRKLKFQPTDSKGVISLHLSKPPLAGQKRKVSVYNTPDASVLNQTHARLFPCCNAHWS